MNRGNSKICRFGRQYYRRRIGSQSNRNQASQRRGFDFRSEIEEGISGDQKAGRQQEALTVYPVGQEPIQQAGEVIFALLCPFHVLLRERDQNGLFPLWLSASTFPFPAVLCLNHLKKYIRIILTALDYIYIISSSQDTNMDNRRLSKKKQVFVLAALCEGTPVRAIARMLRTEKVCDYAHHPRNRRSLR